MGYDVEVAATRLDVPTWGEIRSRLGRDDVHLRRLRTRASVAPGDRLEVDAAYAVEYDTSDEESDELGRVFPSTLSVVVYPVYAEIVEDARSREPWQELPRRRPGPRPAADRKSSMHGS